MPPSSRTRIDDNLKNLYHIRFNKELPRRNKLWRVLTGSFFQQYVNKSDAVMDIGGGYCEFINNIACQKKYVVDLNEDILKFAAQDVEVYNKPLSEIVPLLRSSIDVIFMSNFLEHLKSKDEMLSVLMEVFSIVKPGGRVMILQPNIRYAYKVYWDFFDHHIPLSDKSVLEALSITGFIVDRVVPRFLPYTTKSRIPQWAFLIKVYLKMPVFWKIMGKQMFIVCHRGHDGEVRR
jgi:2-polyprenyl-3-methyl-5-hydroxy-6-metoxy-1,4-benzoquinol methylase